MRLLAVLTVTVLLAAGVCYAEVSVGTPESLARQDVEKTFDSIIAYHQNVRTKFISGPSPKSGNDMPEMVGHDRISLDLGRRAWSAKEESTKLLYRDILISELKSPNAAYRGLACVILGMRFDPSLIPHIGALLDDKAEGVTGYGVSSMPQAGTDYTPEEFWRKCTVCDLARYSLERLTGLSIYTKSDFDAWWRQNSGFQEKLWYWRAKWLYGSPLGGTPDTHYDAQLSSLSPEAALRVLLLCGNGEALRAEAAVGWSGAGSGMYIPRGSRMPGLEFTAAFVKDHSLKSRLLELLAQKRLYPEVTSQSCFDGLVQSIYDFGPSVFARSDVPAIEKAAGVSSPFTAPPVMLTELMAKVAPDSCRRILADALRKHPEQASLAVLLVKYCGSEEAALVSATFAKTTDRYMIARAVYEAAQSGRPVTPAFLCDLVELLPASMNYDWPETCGLLEPLCEAANAIAQKTVVSKEELAEITYEHGKATSEKQEIHNKAVPDAYKSLRGKLIAALRG